MWIGWIEFDLLLGDVHSLKGKRSIIRPLLADVRRHFPHSVAEVAHMDLYRRSEIGFSIVASDRTHVVETLDGVERFVAARPEIELLSTRRGLSTSRDE